MASDRIRDPVLQHGGDASELARVRRELDELRQRLEEETAYYRAELEASRQRVERDSTRLQADEVARRRRAEEQLVSTKAELQQLQNELTSALEKNEQLTRRLAALTAAQREREQAAVADERSAARLAWQEAERELALQERELAAVRRLLVEEQQARQSVEVSVARWEQEAVRARQAEHEATQLVASLKKALWDTAHARRQAESALVALRAGTQQERSIAAERPEAAAAKASNMPRFRDDGYNEVSEEALKTVFFGDLSEDLADDFLLTTADASLDKKTVGQLRAVATQPPPAPAPNVPAAAPVQMPSPLPVAPKPAPPAVIRSAEKVAAAPADGSRGGLRRLLMRLGLVALAGGVIYGMSVAGILDLILGVVAPALS